MPESAPARPHAAPDALLTFTADIFARCGMSNGDAVLLAGTLVESDLRGVHSHGVLRVPEYVRKLTADGVDPRGRPTVGREAGPAWWSTAATAWDRSAPGSPWAAGIARAPRRESPPSPCAGATTVGRWPTTPCWRSRADMIGLATTNALPTMAPWGGAERLLGINPLGVAIPAGDERPIVYDAAFSGTAHGKDPYPPAARGGAPGGWALDAEGRPTTDPAPALDGLLSPSAATRGPPWRC